jgi:Rad3-related DNA helicase
MKDPRKVFNAFKQQCNGKLKKIEAFIAAHENINLTSKDLEELEKLNTALKELWGRMEVQWDKEVFCIEDASVWIELDKLVTTTGKAVDVVLETSK